MKNLQLIEPGDLGAIYDAVRSRLPEEWEKPPCNAVTREMFIAHCNNQKYSSLGFSFAGKPIGGMLFDGSVVHIEVLPEYHGRWGMLWPHALAWVFRQKDSFLIAIDADNEKCLRFLDRNHFPRVAADDKSVTFEVSSNIQSQFRTMVDRRATRQVVKEQNGCTA